MSTAPTTTAPAPSPLAVADSLRNAAWAYLWGGAMCLILALWLGAKYEELPGVIPWLTGLLGVVGIAMAAFQCWLGWQGQTEQWLLKRPLLGIMAVAAGLALLILAVALTIWHGPEALGEAVGAALFGIVAAFYGFILMRPLTARESNPLMEGLLANWSTYRNVLIALGVALVILFLALALGWKVGWLLTPAVGAVLLLGFLCLISALWLSTAYSQITPTLLRTFVLIQGAAAGLIITLATLVQIYLWRQDVFLGGLPGWQGVQGWKVWVCGYAGLFGLTLMFVSLLLARADMRNQPSLRRTLYGFNALLTGLLVLLGLVLLNIVVYAMFPFTFNWTQGRGIYSLAPSTRNLLASMKVPTTIYVTVSENSPAYTDVRGLLNNCLAQTNLLTVRYISPDRDMEEYRKLSQTFPQFFTRNPNPMDDSPGRGLLIVQGDHVLEAKFKIEAPIKVPHTFIPERKLSEIKGPTEQGQKPVDVFNGEIELTQELAFLDEGKRKRKLYFLQGNGELDINESEIRVGQRPPYQDPEASGAGRLVSKLKNDNFEVQGLYFAKELPKSKAPNLILAPEGDDKKRQVPDDCYALVLAGPSNPIPAETLDALERFMDRGGKMLVFLDLLTDPKTGALRNAGLDKLLVKYGIKSANEFALRIPLIQSDPPYQVYATATDSTNPLATQFAGDEIRVFATMVVRPDPASTRYKAEAIFALDPKQKIRLLNNKKQELAVDTMFPPREDVFDHLVKEPLPIVVAVTEEKDKAQKPRLVVFGDVDCIGNYEFTKSFTKNPPMPYYDLFVSSLNWLAERPDVGMRPKESNYFFLKKDLEMSRLIWWPFWLMFLAVVGLGRGMWIVRRR